MRLNIDSEISHIAPEFFAGGSKIAKFDLRGGLVSEKNNISVIQYQLVKEL